MGASLGQQIERYRKKGGFSRKRLAEAIEISYDALCRYERDEREPGILVVANIAKTLNVTIDALVGLEPPSNLAAQNSDESAVLRAFRSLNNLWRDRVLTLISWLPNADSTGRSPGGATKRR